MDINEYDNEGLTKLMHASIDGDYDEVVKLLELGADPNITDNDFGSTKAVQFAGRRADSSNEHKKIYELLIAKTVDYTASDWSNENTNTYYPASYSSDNYSGSSFSLSGILYILGFISLIFSPFTGVTLVSAAAFFVIAWVIDHA